MANETRRENPFEVMVQPDQNVLFTVSFENDQIGNSIVLFKEKPHLLGEGAINLLDLGPSDFLIGKSLLVATNVIAANPDSRDIIVHHKFNGTLPETFTYTGKVAGEGDFFTLITQYNFSSGQK